MNLNKAGLVSDRAEKLVQLYDDVKSWKKAKEIWHEKRMGERGHKSSSDRIFREWKRRLSVAGKSLPKISKLSSLLDNMLNSKAKAQVLYFYLIEGDRLVREYLDYITQDYDVFRRDFFDKSNLYETLNDFFENHDHIPSDYSEKTKKRWLRGIRSVLVEIGVLKDSNSTTAEGPAANKEVLLLTAEYSSRKSNDQENWQNDPVGWRLLFYRNDEYSHLIERLLDSGYWTIRQSLNNRILEPDYEGHYEWVDGS